MFDELLYTVKLRNDVSQNSRDEYGLRVLVLCRRKRMEMYIIFIKVIIYSFEVWTNCYMYYISSQVTWADDKSCLCIILLGKYETQTTFIIRFYWYLPEAVMRHGM
jgi:hypothetical protein